MKKTAEHYNLEAGYPLERYCYDAYVAAEDAADSLLNMGGLMSDKERKVIQDFINLMQEKAGQ